MTEHPILEFWFGQFDAEGAVDPAKKQRWWKKSDEFDALCRSEFESEVIAASAGEREALKESARGCLALILLCDQLTRNIYRNTPKAFASDPVALAATMHLIDQGMESELRATELGFAYMPLMHSEDKEVQMLSIDRFRALKDKGYDTLSFAERHKAIVDRFGRYPHRNEILGRESTPEEIEFLKEPGSSF